jgi:hypothetical protein
VIRTGAYENKAVFRESFLRWVHNHIWTGTDFLGTTITNKQNLDFLTKTKLTGYIIDIPNQSIQFTLTEANDISSFHH